MKNKIQNKQKHNVDNNNDITQYNLNFIDKLVSGVKDMTEEEYRRLLKSMSSFHRYSVGNQFLLHAAGASQVAGFQKWIETERAVKRGAKAIWILAPMISKIEKESGKEEMKIYGFKSIPVFDIADTEGKEVERGLTTKSNIDFDKLKNVAIKLGYNVGLTPLEIATGGYIVEKSITLNSNLNEAEHIGTLLHELCHGELGHTSSMNELGRSRKEQEAETATAIISQILGIERQSQFYLKAWQLNEDIKSSFSKIDLVVKRLISSFLGENIENTT